MDPIKIQKIQAMNKYQKNHPIWFPSLWSSINAFLFVSLPNIKALVFTPKCLFIICNIIVVFLIGESKLVGSKSSPDTELYEEYIRSSKTYQRVSTPQVMKKEKEMKLEVSLIEESVKRVAEEEVKEEEKEVLLVDAEHEQEQEEVEEEEEEENGLPAEELNKRVEDFIARMKKQRRLEAGLLVSSASGY
ncbi:Protein of unknown function DUF761 [Macleaya cordata]|uniref:DUF4408 domain-containing protein n=1 Tax=Macleaya cordata TaxID=56857 RepID=A0A200R411_MACCD|nr:Protein of unknown function DUF761 [Macleaya cordata]